MISMTAMDNLRGALARVEGGSCLGNVNGDDDGG